MGFQIPQKPACLAGPERSASEASIRPSLDMALLHFDGFGAPFGAPSGNGDGMDAEAKLKDLREIFGKKSVLFAEDIAELIGADHATVKKIESGYGIPLPLKKVGNRYGVAIYDVADWLSSPDAPKKPKSSKKAIAPLGKPKRSRPSLGRTLLAMRTQMDFLGAVYAHLEAIDMRASTKVADKDK